MRLTDVQFFGPGYALLKLNISLISVYCVHIQSNCLFNGTDQNERGDIAPFIDVLSCYKK